MAVGAHSIAHPSGRCRQMSEGRSAQRSAIGLNARLKAQESRKARTPFEGGAKVREMNPNRQSPGMAVVRVAMLLGDVRRGSAIS